MPDGDRVHLLMKPDLETHDDDFKVRARQPLAALGTVIAAFDNEPIHINSYFVHFTDAQCVHMLTDDSARGIAPPKHPVDPRLPPRLATEPLRREPRARRRGTGFRCGGS